MKSPLLVIRCEDIEVSKDFYEQLGLVFIKEKHDNGPEYYSSEHDGSIFQLHPNKGEALRNKSRLNIKVSGFETRKNNLTFITTYDPNGKNTYVVVDPDGRNIEIN